MSFDLTYKRRVVTQQEASAFWNSHSRIQRKIENHFTPKILFALSSQIRSFIKAIKIHGYEYAKANIFKIIQHEGISKVIKRLYLKSAYIEANYVLNYLKKKKKSDPGVLQLKRVSPQLGLGFNDLAPLINDYFRIRLLNNSVLPITATTRKIIISHLINEVDRGIPLDTAIANFTDLAITGGSTLSLPRAIRIAKTESTRSLSFGGLIGAYMSGVDVDKVWITSDDERVRGEPNYPAPYPHVSLDRNESELNGSFYNGERINFPGDPDASVENTVNCRCAMFFKEKREPEDLPERQLKNFLLEIFSGLFVGELIDTIIDN